MTPTGERPEWHQRAACRGTGTAIFYPERGSNTTASSAIVHGLCDGCSVRSECQTAGIEDDYGMWGGLTPRERQQQRGRRQGQRRVDVAVCGTDAGYRAHYRRDEDACRHCQWAHAEAVRIRENDVRWVKRHGGDEVAA